MKGTIRTPISNEEGESYHISGDYPDNKVYKFAWLNVIYDESQNRWVNASTGQPLSYTNFKPGVKRLLNESCAAISIGNLDQKHIVDYPGYWYPMNCNDTEKVSWHTCEQSREISKHCFFIHIVTVFIFIVMSRRQNYSHHRPDYKYLGVKGKLFAQGYGRLSKEDASKTCSLFMYQEDEKGTLFNGNSQNEAEIVAEHFKAILPIWINNDNCTLLTSSGEIIISVSCQQRYNFVVREQ